MREHFQPFYTSGGRFFRPSSGGVGPGAKKVRSVSIIPGFASFMRMQWKFSLRSWLSVLMNTKLASMSFSVFFVHAVFQWGCGLFGGLVSLFIFVSVPERSCVGGYPKIT